METIFARMVDRAPFSALKVMAQGRPKACKSSRCSRNWGDILGWCSKVLYIKITQEVGKAAVKMLFFRGCYRGSRVFPNHGLF